MEQHTAVKKMMCEVKLYHNIPPEFYPALREMFRMMYAVGYDYGRASALVHSSKKILQYNCDGELVNSFDSIRDACKRTAVPYESIQSALRRGTKTKSGFFWRYVNVVKEREQPVPPLYQ